MRILLDSAFWIVLYTLFFILDSSGQKIIDSRYWIWILESGYWILDTNFWISDSGYRILNYGYMILDTVRY